MSRVVLAMSGGVDSSVAAALLVEQGYDVVGITMHLFAEVAGGRRAGTCCSFDDAYDARRVASLLGIPHYVASFEDVFREAVIDRFVAEYQRGLTPNPCIPCNDILKLEHLRRRAVALGAEHVATGHYARVVHVDGAVELHRGRDLAKDQSYFLFGLSGDALRQLLLPVGDLSKEEVRAVARRHSLPVAEKPESQDICFVTGGDYAAFVERRAAPIEGEIVDLAGHVLGRHGGIHRFTVGQRRGLSLGGGPRRYVVAIEPDDRRVVVGAEPDLLATGLDAERCSWLGTAPPAPGKKVLGRIRHRSPPRPARVVHAGSTLRVLFDEPVVAVAPGQAVVLYDGDAPQRVLGGGFIRRGLRSGQEAAA